MAKALFLSLPLHGHTNPTLPLVKELVGRGDEVVYYSSAAFATKIEQNNAQYRPYRNSFLADIKGLPERMEQLSWLLMSTTAEVLDHELDEFRAGRPDYILCDSVAPWGQWVAEALGVPVVTSVSTFAFNRHVLAFGLTHGVRPRSARLFLSKVRYVSRSLLLRQRIRNRHGINGPNIKNLMFGRSGLNIVYTSRHFQPCANTFDDSFQFVGPSIDDRTETVRFPWERVRDPIVVYVSMGTLFNTDATFYRNCFEAFRGEDFQVIMSIGATISEGSLGPIPANFIVQSHVPQLEVLRRAKAFVTHGGMNSVSESLYHGVTVVVIPQMSEQEIVGRRVEELGAGLYLSKSEATAEKLRESVRRLLTEDQFCQQTELVRESFQSAGGVACAANAILAFTSAARAAKLVH
jgi:MGT family glycosyltransferase